MRRVMISAFALTLLAVAGAYIYPVVINGQNTVTNPISGTQQFFWLSQ